MRFHRIIEGAEVNHELGPLPAAAQVRLDGPATSYVRLYTAGQLRAYALSEVEKAVKAEQAKFIALCKEYEGSATAVGLPAAIGLLAEMAEAVKEWQ